MRLLTIDFEASCLPRHGRSYPIEVGIADGAGWMRSWLIRPDSEWAGWTWTAEAETLHGIDRDQLMREGEAPRDVMIALNAVAGAHRVVADHDLDRRWLATLADAAGIAAEFRIGHIGQLLDEWQPAPARLEHALAVADARVPVRHRAAPDALWLATLAKSIAPQATDAALFDWGAGSHTAGRERPGRGDGGVAVDRPMAGH